MTKQQLEAVKSPVEHRGKTGGTRWITGAALASLGLLAGVGMVNSPLFVVAVCIGLGALAGVAAGAWLRFIESGTAAAAHRIGRRSGALTALCWLSLAGLVRLAGPATPIVVLVVYAGAGVLAAPAWVYRSSRLRRRCAPASGY